MFAIVVFVSVTESAVGFVTDLVTRLKLAPFALVVAHCPLGDNPPRPCSLVVHHSLSVSPEVHKCTRTSQLVVKRSQRECPVDSY